MLGVHIHFLFFLRAACCVQFIVQPRSDNVEEGKIAQFNCQIDDPSYIIYWIVNDTSADFDAIVARGVTKSDINRTASQLHIVSTRSINNTNIRCAAEFFVEHILVDFDVSAIAMLRIVSPTTTTAAYNTKASTRSTISGLLLPKSFSGGLPQPTNGSQPSSNNIAIVIGIPIGVAVIIIILLLLLLCVCLCYCCYRYSSYHLMVFIECNGDKILQ